MATASYSIHPPNSKYSNWVEACLAVLITKEGIEPFVFNEIKQFQQKCLADIYNNNGLPSGTICSSCCTENVVVCPTNKLCNAGRGRCRYHTNVSKQYLPAGCPNQICHNLKNEIQNVHRYHGPSYKNTDATQWCSNPWEVAKCFMPPDGYKNVTSPAKTDFNGIINVIINNVDFQAKITDDLSKANNIFEKGRSIGREVRHSPSLEVEDADLLQYYTDLQNLLSDPKIIASNNDVLIARNKLSQLQNDTLVIDLKNFRQMLEDVAKDVQQDLRQTKKDQRKESEKRKLALIKSTRKAVAKIKSSGQSSLSDIKEALKSALSEIEKIKTECSINKIQLKTAEGLKKFEKSSERIQKDLKRKLDTHEIQEGVKKLKTEPRAGVSRISSLTDESIRQIEERMSSISDQTEAEKCKISKKEEPAERLNIFQRLWRRLRWKREYNRKKEGTESDWTTSIENKDEEKMYELLEKGQIPDAALLDKACQTFGLKSPILKDISTKIEENITASSDCIIYTYACYKETEKDEIVFVVITREATDYVDLSKVKYSVLVRSKDVCSPEGKIILDKEIGLRFEDSEMEALESVLKEKSPYLMENHSNLTLTTGSMFKSQYLDAEEFSVEKNICIVLYVTVKGLIPVGEDLFPTKLGQFNTDVREGRFYFAAGGPPKAKHEQLNIGCRISCKDGSGTIGGFVQHPKQGVCAITCAHVVLSDSETNKLLKKKKENHGIGIGKECFQPDYNKNGDEKCGEVVEVKMIQGDSNDVGVDVALVQINDNRLPTDWRFPDCDSFHLVWGCSQCKGILHTHMPPFKTCTILDTDQITTQTNVVKYGQETQFTFGEVKVKGGSARFEIERKKGTLTLHNLFEICNKSNNLDYPFASEGDSGSLVFSNGENNELHAFGLLVGCRGSITLVQPICSVLEHLSFQRPFPFISFD